MLFAPVDNDNSQDAGPQANPGGRRQLQTKRHGELKCNTRPGQVKSQNGDLVQWDFGPVGGDSTLGRKAEATAAGLLRNPFVRGGKRRRQPAEIREVKVSFPGGVVRCTRGLVSEACK